jgi:thioredoxin reductase (NADPH)
MDENIDKTKCLIIGSGPAGYTSAIYASRAFLKPILYQGLQVGGQLTITTRVENLPGYPEGEEGSKIMKNIEAQAKRFGTDIRFGRIIEVDFSSRPFKVKADDGKIIIADTVIIATGASARWLDIESGKKFYGSGVSTCAVCDGFFYKNKDVAVVGGGDTAAEESTYLAKLCNKVYLIHRRNEMRASKIMQSRVFNCKNIVPVFEYIVDEILGDDKGVTALKIKSVKNNDTRILNVDGVFIAIGHVPNTSIFKGQIDMDDKGYIITKPGTSQTSVEGVFAAGDVQDKSYRQAVTAMGSGCIAAIDAERFLALTSS